MPKTPFEFKYRWNNGHPDLGTYVVRVDLNGDHLGQIHKELSFAISVAKLKQKNRKIKLQNRDA